MTPDTDPITLGRYAIQQKNGSRRRAAPLKRPRKPRFSPAKAAGMIVLAALMIVGGVLSVLGSTGPLSFALGALAIPAGVNCLYLVMWLAKQ